MRARLLRGLAVAALAVAAGPGALSAAQAEGESLFSVNLGLSAWTVVVFLAVLFVLKKYAWGPILETVDAREDRIQGALDEAAREREEARRLLEEHKEKIAEARREAQEIIAQGREAGEKVRRQIEEDARAEGRRLIEQARREIEREKEAALETVRSEAVDLALAAASRLLDEKMDAERDRILVQDFLEDLNRERTEATA